MLDSLFVTPAVTAIDAALASARADGKVAVIGHAKIASALADKREVVAVGVPARAAKKLTGTLPDLSSVDDRSLAAVIAVDTEDAPLADWARVIRDGGALVLVDRGSPAAASKRALCACLTELEQRTAGRVVVTSGLVTHLD